MFYKSHINKAAAGLLLIVLLFIHSVKLLHNHSLRQCHSVHAAAALCKMIDDTSWSSGDCSICNYHLTKDAYTNFSTGTLDHPVYLSDFNPENISFKKTGSFYLFETRGPPALF